eukprot:g19184.t1
MDALATTHSSMTPGKQSSPSSPVTLPPVTALEKDAYFGHKARAEFLDIFRQLSRQRHVYKDSKFDTDSVAKVTALSAPKVGAGQPAAPKTKGRVAGGRFNRETEQASTPSRRGMKGKQSGVQSFGGTGVMVRTNTKPNMTLEESAETEEHILNSHLKMTAEPGSFPRPLSPRSRFLLGCLNSDVVPRPSMLIRKELTYVLNLEHHLDVSENKIDELAASALSGYLQKRDCKLINLVMRKSDVDDNEIGDFVQEERC